MGQANHVCGPAEFKQVRDWDERLAAFKPCYKTLLSENLGTYSRECPAGKSQCRSTQIVVEANRKPHDTVIYTDGSVTRDRSG